MKVHHACTESTSTQKISHIVIQLVIVNDIAIYELTLNA